MKTPINTLMLWGRGSVTLPKEWRDQYPTKIFFAEETAEGYLLIKPIVPVEFYEEPGRLGLRFPMGMEAGELLQHMHRVSKKLDASYKKKKKKNS